MKPDYVMLVVSAPKEHGDAVRKAIGDAGGGKIGDYTRCSFSYLGTGRFFGTSGTSPTYGKRGELSEVLEERIEVLCKREHIHEIIAAMKKVHPYEEPAYHVQAVEIL